MSDGSNRFETLGGEPKLRAIIDDFVERVCGDMMIGFFFAHANKARIKAKEYEHAAEWLGAGVAYSGRSLREAHRKHPILGGQFARRRQILAHTLRDHGVDLALIQDWLAHQDSLRAEITQDALTECNDGATPRTPDATDPTDTTAGGTRSGGSIPSTPPDGEEIP